MKHIKRVNIFFLITTIVALSLPFLPFELITTNYCYLLIIEQLILALPVIVYLVTEKKPIVETVRLNKVKFSNIILVIIMLLLLMPLMTLVNAISLKYVVNSSQDIMTELVFNNPLWLSMLAIAVMPCIFEELVYRGVFFNEYRKLSPIIGIVLSSMMFGIMHGNFNQFSYAFVMGIIFTLVIEATDSIISSSIMHFLINSQSVVLLYVLPKAINYVEKLYQSAQESGNTQMVIMIQNATGMTEFDSATMLDTVMNTTVDYSLGELFQIYGFTVLICTALAFLVFKTIAKNTGRWEHMKALFLVQKVEGVIINEKKTIKDALKKIVSIPLVAGITLCILGMVANEILSRVL